MGFQSRKPNSNDIPVISEGKSPYLKENEFVGERALLIMGMAKRCRRCYLAVRVEYLVGDFCPECK